MCIGGRSAFLSAWAFVPFPWGRLAGCEDIQRLQGLLPSQGHVLLLYYQPPFPISSILSSAACVIIHLALVRRGRKQDGL